MDGFSRVLNLITERKVLIGQYKDNTQLKTVKILKRLPCCRQKPPIARVVWSSPRCRAI